MANITAILGEQRLFADLTDDELAAVADITGKRDFPTGDTIFATAQEERALYLIRSGEVKICMAAPDGELFTLRILKEGDIFGAMSFVDATPRSATAIAIADVTVLAIEGADFDKLTETHPRAAAKLMCQIIESIHMIVHGMNSRYIEMINYMWGRKRFT